MKISKLKVYDIEESIQASKYPMSDSTEDCTSEITKRTLALGHANGCSGHDCMLKGILVSFDLTFTNKAWVELERYHFIDIVSSQSTMHRIAKLNIRKQCNKYVWDSTIESLDKTIAYYNSLDKNTEEAKEVYLEILYNVPSGFELTARVTTNYLQLKTMYKQRLTHRLPEWKEFCVEIEKLPYFKELVLDV